jgi:hypothetical protein
MDLALRQPANSLQYSQYTNGSFFDGLMNTLQALGNKNFLTDLKRTIRAFEGQSAADVGGGFKRLQLGEDEEGPAKRGRR